MRSTGGEQLSAFEGLVHTTARMFADQVGREETDLAQELRIRVWRAVESYDPAKSSGTLERYVFSAVTNKIKDYKRDAARERKRRDDHGISFIHIEDMGLRTNGYGDLTTSQQEAFADLYHYIDRDEVYGEIEDGKFVLPANVTESEASVLVLLMVGMRDSEIVMRLAISRDQLRGMVGALQEKFAAWAPESFSRSVELDCAA